MKIMKNNMYDEHPLMINSGAFWRCKHGNTGHDKNLNFIGCEKCKKDKDKEKK